MKAKHKKPAIFKTFSEFTIEELRSMPLPHLFSLFFDEVSTTFTDRELPRKQSKKRGTKKKITKPILVAKMKKTHSFSFPHVHTPHIKISTGGFTAAMKRVFTPGSVPEYSVKKKETNEKKENEETVVYSKPPLH